MTTAYLEELVSKYANGEATEKEVAELMHWYRSQGIEDVEWLVDTPAEIAALRYRMVERMRQEIEPQKAKTISFSWMRAAAALIIFAGIASLLYYLAPFSPTYITVNNPSGKIRLLTLPDSSRVWLNASTQLEYAKDFALHRKLKLNGEAYFEVKPDTSHPFIVEAGTLTTTVVGTSFNIEAYSVDHEATISVTSGMVKVAGAPGKPVLLNPSMQLRLNTTTKQLTTNTIDTSSVMAWKEGRLQFHGQTMGDIAQRLEHWYEYKIIFSNPGMARCRYYMTFKNTLSPDQLFSAMSEVADIHYTINHHLKTVNLTGSECR